MSRGIDPTTHRAMNEESAAKTISFAVKEEKTSSSGSSNGSPVRESKCPDLNLDLRISPPYHHHQQNQVKTGTAAAAAATSCTLCFACSLGIQNSKDCTCTNGPTAGINSGYDFLGLKTNGVLDYRSLEMK